MISIYLGNMSRFFLFEKEIMEEKLNRKHRELYDMGQKGDEELFFRAIQGQSLFEESKLIVVKRLEKIKKSAEFMKSIIAYSSTPHRVIMEGEGECFTEKQREKLGTVFTLSYCNEKNIETPFVNFITSELKCSRSDAISLFSQLPLDFYYIKNSVEKLVLYFYETPFILQEALFLIQPKEQVIFNLIDKLILQGEGEILLEYIEEKKQGMLFLSLLMEELILYSFLKEYQTICSVDLSRINYSTFSKTHAPKLTQHLYKHPYAYFQKLAQLDKIEYNKLRDAIHELYCCEFHIKTGISSETIAIAKLIKKLEFLKLGGAFG